MFLFIAFCPSEAPIQDLAAPGFYLKKVQACLSPDLIRFSFLVCVVGYCLVGLVSFMFFCSQGSLGLLTCLLTWSDGLSSLVCF